MSTKDVAELEPGDVIVGTAAGPVAVRGVTPSRRGGRQTGWRISGGRAAGWVTTMDATVEVAEITDLAAAWIVRHVIVVPMNDGRRPELVSYWNGRYTSADSDPASPQVRMFVSAAAAQAAIDGTFRSTVERRRWTPVLRADVLTAVSA